MLAAATLMLLHLAAFFQADDIIMREIPGSHPYLTGLGILGGIYSFANPLQGTVSYSLLDMPPMVLLTLLPVMLWVCIESKMESGIHCDFSCQNHIWYPQGNDITTPHGVCWCRCSVWSNAIVHVICGLQSTCKAFPG